MSWRDTKVGQSSCSGAAAAPPGVAAAGGGGSGAGGDEPGAPVRVAALGGCGWSLPRRGVPWRRAERTSAASAINKNCRLPDLPLGSAGKAFFLHLKVCFSTWWWILRCTYMSKAPACFDHLNVFSGRAKNDLSLCITCLLHRMKKNTGKRPSSLRRMHAAKINHARNRSCTASLNYSGWERWFGRHDSLL